MSDDRPLRVALYAGIVVRRDAVSWSLLHKLEALRHLIALGAPIEVTVFAQSIDDPGPEFVLCPSVAKLLGQQAFWEADLHIFEEGMYYELFNSVFLIPPEKPILAIEHNSTPVDLVEVASMRAAVERSHLQRRNLLRASHVACVSEFNVDMARAAGVPDDRISILHLPPAIVPRGPVRPLSAHRGPVRLLYLGRFVRAKGIADMLELARRLALRDTRFHITLAGDPRFSDPQLMTAAQEAADASPSELEIVWAPDDEALAELYAESDALVVPSYHEGYCVPVIEAYSFGRYVVAYDAGNLPIIVGGLGTQVPTGDVAALEEAVRSFAASILGVHVSDVRLPTTQGPMPLANWAVLVGKHLAQYSPSHFESGFLHILERLVADADVEVGDSVQAIIGRRLAQLVDVA